MMNSHIIHPELLTRPVQIDVIGAGGTGSQLMNNLLRLHLGMIALGHPGGLQVTLWDDDVVSEANIGRQAFYPCDIGSNKASTIINRINLPYGLRWVDNPVRLDSSDRLSSDIVIGCVDNRKARSAILKSAERGWAGYWLDCGNRLGDGQIILGEVFVKKRNMIRLPHAADLFPELVDSSLDAVDDTPSCSLADALEKQSLFINSTIALLAVNILTDLFRHGEIKNHGSFVNLTAGRISPLQVNEECWKRFGYGANKPKTARKSKRSP